MITSVHTLIYSDNPPATRAFLRDVLGWPSVEDPGSEPGWLIFRSGPSEVGVHPTSGTWEENEFRHAVHHELSLMCDDINATKAELEGKGAVFQGDVVDEGFGVSATVELPGAGTILLYEPRHSTAFNL